MRHIPILLAVTLALTGVAATAHAHAHLRSATPAMNAIVPAPHEVAITFTEELEPRFSSIEVQDASGMRVDMQDAHTAPSDNKVFSVGLLPLRPGTYTVIWRATAVDTHKTEGTYQFTVRS